MQHARPSQTQGSSLLTLAPADITPDEEAPSRSDKAKGREGGGTWSALGGLLRRRGAAHDEQAASKDNRQGSAGNGTSSLWEADEADTGVRLRLHETTVAAYQSGSGNRHEPAHDEEDPRAGVRAELQAVRRRMAAMQAGMADDEQGDAGTAFGRSPPYAQAEASAALRAELASIRQQIMELQEAEEDEEAGWESAPADDAVPSGFANPAGLRAELAAVRGQIAELLREMAEDDAALAHEDDAGAAIAAALREELQALRCQIGEIQQAIASQPAAEAARPAGEDGHAVSSLMRDELSFLRDQIAEMQRTAAARDAIAAAAEHSTVRGDRDRDTGEASALRQELEALREQIAEMRRQPRHEEVDRLSAAESRGGHANGSAPQESDDVNWPQATPLPPHAAAIAPQYYQPAPFMGLPQLSWPFAPPFHAAQPTMWTMPQQAWAPQGTRTTAHHYVPRPARQPAETAEDDEFRVALRDFRDAMLDLYDDHRGRRG